jgi:hypothetical protein
VELTGWERWWKNVKLELLRTKKEQCDRQTDLNCTIFEMNGMNSGAFLTDGSNDRKLSLG